MNGVVNVQPAQRPNKLVKLLLTCMPRYYVAEQISFGHYNGSQRTVAMK